MQHSSDIHSPVDRLQVSTTVCSCYIAAASGVILALSPVFRDSADTLVYTNFLPDDDFASTPINALQA